MTAPTGTPRYYALDSVRATAMLLGVFYHSLLFGAMAGGGPPGPGGPEGASLRLQEWLHSFRMPLFFLIAGFFCRMMRHRYGTRVYLARRWWRLGVPLLLGLFTVVPLYQLSMFGGGAPPGPGSRPGPPPGIGGPWEPAAKGANLPPPGFPKPEFGPRGPGRPGPPEGGPFGPPGPLSTQLFGPYARYFTLSNLWFLWYLLVFATVTPWLTGALGWLAARVAPGAAEAISRRVLGSGLAPLICGLVSVPALLLCPSFFGWSLGLASGIGRGFPDFLLRLEPDMPFYFLYFLSGWWLHRERDGLAAVARPWLPNLLVGTVAHAAAAACSATYARQADLPDYELLRLGGYSLYALGSAYTAFGVLGFFQKYVNRPSSLGRYMGDTAFWVYLVHQPLLVPILRWFAPLGLPWWVQGPLATALTTAAALLIFEATVRPTPLLLLFGPGAGPARPSPPPQRPAGSPGPEPPLSLAGRQGPATA